jgi:glycosyltransferase involved in cell wall biosynthesis
MKESKKKILFIGPTDYNIVFGGDTIKNSLLVRALKKIDIDLEEIDTTNWKIRKFSLFLKILKKLIQNKKNHILISINPDSGIRFVNMIKKIGLLKIINLNYLVIGGNLPSKLETKKQAIKHFSKLNSVLVESSQIKRKLEHIGLGNVVHINNFKDFSFKPKSFQNNENFSLVFFSRVCKEKGVELAINAVSDLSKEYNIKLDIFGPIKKEYSRKFDSLLKSSFNVEYKGVLEPNANKTYEVLSQYDLMLFPTFHEGEGFPGAIIDSYIAGVTVLASDWKYNFEIVEVGKTGWLVEPRNIDDLKNKLVYIIENKEILKEMRKNCVEEAKKYHVDNVIPKLLKEMGIEE